MRYEYLALPAPSRTKAVKGQKTAAERIASAVTDLINEMAEDDWEYLRTETLTVEHRPHRFSKVVDRIETVMIFRREVSEAEFVANHARREEEAEAVDPLLDRPIAPRTEDFGKPREEEAEAVYDAEAEPEFEPVEEIRSPALGGITRD